MKLHIVVKRCGDYPWRAENQFLERRMAKNWIECEQANDHSPKWEFGIVSGEIVLAQTAEGK